LIRRVLVTGGCGFVGIPVVERLLDRGDEVVVFDDLRRGSGARPRQLPAAASLVVGDIRDVDLLATVFGDQQTDLAVHLAAMPFIPDCNRDPAACMSVNVSGTASLLRAVDMAPSVRGVIHISTAAIYAPDTRPHTETCRVAPDDVYGNSKLAAEVLVSDYGRRSRQAVGIARLFNVYGPGGTNEHLIPAVARQAISGHAVKVGNLDTVRDYVSTADVSRGIDMLGDLVMEGRSLICNLGTGIGRSGHDVVRAVGRALGVDLDTISDHTRVRRTDRPVLLADTRVAKAVLGWSATASFDEGVKRVIDDLRPIDSQTEQGYPPDPS
jgi:UDP-glucose 4-epimerase